MTSASVRSWTTVQLHEVCKPKQWQTIKKSEMTDTGYAVYGANGVIGRYHSFNHEDPTVLIGCRGTCGAVTVSEPFAWVTGNSMALDELDTSVVDVRYLVHALVADGLRDAVTGTSQPQITQSSLKRIHLPLPPLQEQKRIAAILDAAEVLLAKRRRASAKFDELVQSMFVDMFGDPVTNPKHWPTDALTALGQLDRGVSKHRPRNDPLLLGGAWPLIQTGDIANSDGYITSHTSTYSDVGLAQSKIWPAGTLCITIAANIAKTGILTFDACFPDSVVGFTETVEGAGEYVRILLNFLQPILERQAPESAQKNINLKTLRGLRVPAPPAELLARFAEYVAEVNVFVRCGLQQQTALDTLIASLQQRAFRGEL